jgi:hypothetical protein
VMSFRAKNLCARMQDCASEKSPAFLTKGRDAARDVFEVAAGRCIEKFREELSWPNLALKS